MRNIFTRLRQNRGQMLVMFVLMFSVISMIGVAVVDVGLLYSERRADQKEADLPALAGARQCMLEMVDLAGGGTPRTDYVKASLDAVEQVWQDNVPGHVASGTNGYSYTASGCFDPSKGPDPTSAPCTTNSPYCCVDVVAKHKSPQFFSKLPFAGGILDSVAQNMDAKARACAGAAVSPGSSVPAYVVSGADCFDPTDPGKPYYSHYCWVAGGAHDQYLADRQNLNLDVTGQHCSPGGKNQEATMFSNEGVGGICWMDTADPPTVASCGSSPWSDCVTLDPGNNFHATAAVATRLSSWPCDKNGNHIDDLSEVIDPTTREPIICSPNAPAGQQISPRLITVPIIDDAGTGTCAGGPPCPILGFASFYIAGCVSDKDLDPILLGTQALTDAQIKCQEHEPPGHDAVLGTWVNITTIGSGVGPANGTSVYGFALCDWETDIAHGGCGSPATPTPVPTTGPSPTRTATPAPPTATPRPTATPTRTPTPVPPTATPMPTSTPKHPKRTPTPTKTPNH